MQVTLTPPHESEASAEWSDDESLVIEPYFAHPTGVKNIASVVVAGKNGQERRFVLQVSGKNGRLTVSEAKKVETEFDKPIKKTSRPPATSAEGMNVESPKGEMISG